MLTYAFGRFRLFVAERRLEQDGVEVRIGSRALDLLTVLIENAGQPVSKSVIARRVWPGVIVGETSLRFQIVGLRRLLGDESERVIATLPGRGYCFVAPPLSSASPSAIASPRASDQPRPSLPARLSHMVGREGELVQLMGGLQRHRFVSIVGTGGIGKTTLAIATAHRFARENACGVGFVDLGAVREPERVVATLSAALGVSVDEEDALPGLLAYLRSRHLLIVLDCCEHVVDAVAALAERLFQELPDVRLLATSREALRAEGEQVFALKPFPFPAEGDPVTLGALLEFPAARLFIERAMAAGSRLTLGEEDAPVIAEICRRLDGIALAIELAAGRVPTYGLRGTVALLSDRFRHLHGGRRTAIPRHRTLRDTLAWSHELLDQRARQGLQRLCVFVGEFELEAAVVIADRQSDEASTREIVEELVAKSLLALHRTDEVVTYRLLDTLRAYLLPRFEASDDVDAVRRRHALFYSVPSSPANETIPQNQDAARIPNLRAALAWCFGARGDPTLGVTLAATAAPVFLRTSLLTECVEVCRKALATIGQGPLGTRAEMELQACLGQSLMFTAGNTSDVESAFEVALDLANRLREPVRELQLLGALHLFHERNADFGKAMDFAQRAFALAERMGNGAYIAAAHSLLGLAWHLHGEHAKADWHLDFAMRSPAGRELIDPIGFGFDHRNRACITRARSLWLQGQAEEGAVLARRAVEDSATLGHPVTHCIALIWAFSVSEWRNDLDSMQEYVERFVAHAERHSLRPYRPLGECMKGQIEIRRGHALAGIERIEHHMASLRAARYELLNTGFLCTMAEGMMAIGNLDSAAALIVDCEASVRRHGDRIHLPEVLRIRASIVAALGREDEAATLLQEALYCARMQGARAWEQRIEVDLSALERASGAAGKVVRSSHSGVHS